MSKHQTQTRSHWLTRLSASLVIIVLAGSAGSVQAKYPSRPIKIVAAYSPGGSSDLAARTFAQALERHLDANVIVQNRAGAGGIVGTNTVFNDSPDGYSLLLGRVATLAVAPALEKVPYDPKRFTYLGLISKDPYACVTSAKKPYKSLADLKNAVLSKPGSLTYSSSGTGTLTQIAAVQVLSSIGAENPRFAATHIPYHGEGPALAAAIGGHVDFFCGNLAPMSQNIKAGKLTVLFVTTSGHFQGLDALSTAKELGYPELASITGWSAIVAPPGMDEKTKTTLVNAMKEVKNDEQWVDKVKSLGSIPAVETPTETRAFIESQYEGFQKLVERLNLKVN